MKIGFISSYNSVCGISEYTKNLVEGLKNFDMVDDIIVVANYNDKPVVKDEDYVHRLFHCPFMTHQETATINEIFKLLWDCDIVHCQFQTSLYSSLWFPDMVYHLKAEKPNRKIVFTFHDSGIWQEFNCKNVDAFITHEPMWCSTHVIPMGVKSYACVNQPEPNTVCSFGLGRNNDVWIEEAIKDTNYKFNKYYGHQGIWLSRIDLMENLASNWVISLLYPPTGANVSSSAVMTALGIDRPILITNTNWFSHVIDYPGLYICDSIDEVKENLEFLFDPQNVDKIKEDINLRNVRLKEDERDYFSYLKKHLNVYESLI